MKMHDILPEDRARMDKLYAYLHGKETNLTEQEKLLINRVSFADDQLRARKTDSVVIKLLRIKYPEISLSTARNDLITAKYVFSSLSILDKSYGLQLLLQMNMQMLDHAIQDGDSKNANALMKTRMELLKMIDDTEQLMNAPSIESNSYTLNISLTGGRPKKIDLESVHEMDEDDYEILENRIHESLIPKSIIGVLKKSEDE